MPNYLSLNELRERTIHHLSLKTHRALQKGWTMLYPSLRSLYKQDDTQKEWEDWERIFIVLMAMAMEDESDLLAQAEAAAWLERGRELAANPGGIFHNYMMTGESRIAGIVRSTRSGVQADIAQWQGEGGDFNDLVSRLQLRFDRDRAERIADYETSQLLSATARDTGTQLGIYTWTWIHIGADDPCVEFCLDRIGQRFSFNEPMPPSHLY